MKDLEMKNLGQTTENIHYVLTLKTVNILLRKIYLKN